MNQYGKADYMLAVMYKIVRELSEKSIITAKQSEQINKLNKKTVNDNYLSIAELEVSA